MSDERAYVVNACKVPWRPRPMGSWDEVEGEADFDREGDLPDLG